MTRAWHRPKKPGPYIARSASDKTDDWPLWYVAGPDGRTNYFTDLGGKRNPPLTPMFTSREDAEMLAARWNGTAT
jgi:hypothetical protein